MRALNWKDRASSSEARASRAVGGRYRVIYRGSYLSWRGETVKAHYEVEYRRYARLDWDDIDYPPNTAVTLAEAKRIAEEDHEQRRQEAATVATAEFNDEVGI
jgi:hypothetical protein